MTFMARYAGLCTDCGERIRPGMTCTWSDTGSVVHADCEEAIATEEETTVCPKCFLTTCDCGRDV